MVEYDSSGKFGFTGNPHSKKKKEDYSFPEVSGALENNFADLVRELKLEEEILSKEIKAEKEILKRVVQLNKESKKLELEIEDRNATLSMYNSIYEKNPKKGLEILNSVDKLDQDLFPRLSKFSEELQSHLPNVINEIFEKHKTSSEELEKVRMLIIAIQGRFNIKFSKVQNEIQNRSTEAARRYLLSLNPDLNN